MEKTDIIYIGIVVLLIGSFAYLASQKDIAINFQTALSPESYVEFRCEDVTQYKSQGYTYLKTDEHGCEIVKKSTTFQTRTTTVSGTCPSWDLNQGLIMQQCGGEQFLGYSNCVIACGYTITVYEGGYEQVVNTCQYDINDLLAVQSFHGGQSIKKSSTQYPVKDFCPAHPSIIINSDSQQSITSTVIYEKLDAGETLDIPSNEVWTLFYILENNYQLPTICKGSEGLALNTETKTCVASTGIVYTCQQGQFDPSIGACVVQPETACSVGRLVKYEDGTYECVYTPPLNVDCSSYGIGAYYSVNLDKCIVIPEIKYQCTAGVYDEFQGVCLVEPEYKCEIPLNAQGECTAGLAPSCSVGYYNMTIGKCIAPIDDITYYCVKGMLATNPITGNKECQDIAPEKTVVDCRAAGGTLEASTGNCIFPAPKIIESPCGYGTTWDASVNQCIAGTVSLSITKEAAAKETKGFIYKYWHWLLLLLVAVAVIVYFRFYR